MLAQLIVVDNCIECGKLYTLQVNECEYVDWRRGELIQKSMPHLLPAEREFLISRLCPSCQEDYFFDENEE